jgi:3-oxoacyl-[acyl-carrier protein] reductase
MNLDLTGRHALVCGASQGIGRATAIELARLGADVTVLARTEARLQTLVAELPRLHGDQRHGYVAAAPAKPRRARSSTRSTSI